MGLLPSPWDEVLRVIAGHLWALLGAIAALIVAIKSGTRRAKLALRAFAVAFTLLFLFLAISDGYLAYQKYDLAEHLARLQHSGRKRYDEWWTRCHDPAKAAVARKESNDWRENVRERLRTKLGEARASHFNTPKAMEPFPETTARLCPDAVLINQHGHRVERLGEIIAELRQR